jgi:thiol-disulfide isomerase/thioredoxin
MKLQRLLIGSVLLLAFSVPLSAQPTSSSEARWTELEQAIAKPDALRGAAWTSAAELAWKFHEENPTDARRWVAWTTLLRNLPRFENDANAKRVWTERTSQLEKTAATATDVPEALREHFLARKVSAFVLPHTNGKLPANWQEILLPPLEDLAQRFPDGGSAFVYYARLTSALESQFPDAMPAFVERMMASPNRRVQSFGAERSRVLKAMAQPLELKFTALDGREVDTTKMRGKVILVDYWATWCVPCIQSMPHLKELYAKYHDRGLEIINISVDRANARKQLEELIAKLDLPWPQFFDGKGPQTEYAVRYGVQPIPHVLLAGPDGKIVAVNPPKARLESEVERLLARSPR